jgi:predicted dehydrogenase
MNAAIIGLGWWGRLMVDSVRGRSDRLRFTHAVVRQPDASRPFADSRGVTLLPAFEDVLAHPGIDAVMLATPHSSHVAQIIACAQAGKPVYSEKPLALSLTEARRAVDACAEAGVVLGLGTDRRELPAVKRLKRLVADGGLGDLLHLEAQYSNDTMTRGLSGDWRSDPEEAPGAGMTGPGLHVLDLLLHLAGPLAEVDGRLIRPFGETVPTDALTLMLAFEGGQTGTLGCVRGVPDYFRLAAFGTRGWAEVRQFGAFHAQTSGYEPVIEDHAPELAIREMQDLFADAVAGRGAFPVSTRDMLRTVAAFEATIESLRTGGRIRVETVA